MICKSWLDSQTGLRGAAAGIGVSDFATPGRDSHTGGGDPAPPVPASSEYQQSSAAAALGVCELAGARKASPAGVSKAGL